MIKPVPAGLDWDEWPGPAPYRGYHDGLHPFCNPPPDLLELNQRELNL